MRNQNSKVRVIKRKLSKCTEVCRTYSSLQFAYAEQLEHDDSIKEFRCNVPLIDFPIEGSFTTDFLITRQNGDFAVRECITRDKITKPLQIKLLDASRLYWLKRGISDWGLVTNASE